MKQVYQKLIAILSEGDFWLENCQLKPKHNFEEEIWVERLFIDESNLIKVQYREVDQVNAPRFVDNAVNLFKPAQIKFLLELAEFPNTYTVDINGEGTKGEIIASLEKILNDIKRSDIEDYLVEGEALITTIENKNG